MTFIVGLIDNWNFKETVQINTIEDLKKLYERFGNNLLIDFEEATITIYDNYFE